MKRITVALVTWLVLVAPAWAGPIVIGGSSAWNAAGGADFWANRSYDRNGVAHVGIFLTGAAGSDVPGFYDHSPYLTNLVYLGGGSTTFAWGADWAPVELLRVSDWRAVDRLDRLADGVLQFATPAGVWRSDTLDNGRSHFTVFDAPGFYYVGMEDATWTTRRPADWDYQDLVIRVPKSAVPEVGSTLALMGVLLPAWVGGVMYRTGRRRYLTYTRRG